MATKAINLYDMKDNDSRERFFVRNDGKIINYAGPWINFRDNKGNSIMHIAVQKGNVDVLQLLLSTKDMFIDMKNNEQKTPFVIAIENKNWDIVKILLPNCYGSLYK